MLSNTNESKFKSRNICSYILLVAPHRIGNGGSANNAAVTQLQSDSCNSKLCWYS